MSEDRLICAYCGAKYNWINHKHTTGFYEHELDSSDEPNKCKFISHKIIKELKT